MIPVDLNDKYDLSKDRIFTTGTQALVRLCLMQSAKDRAAGLRTAGYVSGYRGSPLGGLDQQFPRAKAALDEAEVTFAPALNEDLAATAIWGTQQAELRGEGTHDGVFGMWYGKGPGVDRSGDAFRHANLSGTSPHGGVLAIMGDDHTCESSTTAHQSEFAFVDACMPVFNPAGIEDIFDFGLHGWALSRFAGVWCGLKMVKDNVESTASIDARPEMFTQIIPDCDLPEGGLNIRLTDTPQEQEARLHRYKLDAVQAYLRANPVNKVVLDGGQAPRVGIVSTGKSYMDVLQALDELGIDDARAASLGIALYKIGVSWPLEPEGLRRFATGLQTLIVVEEKRGLIEDQIKAALYGTPTPPVIVGKRDEAGGRLFQAEGALNPMQIAVGIGQRIKGDAQVTAKTQALYQMLDAEREEMNVSRKPYFCAGCPHNSSTVVPEGSRAYAGIGCHYMVQWMDRETLGYTHMGAEGANWIGEALYSKRDHVFQNLGDGTYNHSGLQAVRAAIGAGVNITYKLLYNDAVAMTGGQTHDGGMDIYQIAAELKAMGVRVLRVVTDDVDRIETGRLPSGVDVQERGVLALVQRELSEVKGVSALIYDQTCAAEKRRRRKRGLMEDPPRRVFINPEVCEGCGDCSMQSNCVAILPHETPLGAKRKIDQSACNKDFSCLKGFCPSFVTVEGGALRKPEMKAITLPDIPEPLETVGLDHPYAIALTGVGGTGVVTIGALLGMAAHIEGKGCGIIDMAGLAQKGGAVVSHIKIGKEPRDIKAIRIATGGADLVLGGDMVVAAGANMLASLNKDRGAVVVNSYEMMTMDFVKDRDFKLPGQTMEMRIRAAVGERRATFVNATDIAVQTMGDSIAANAFLLGVAYQKGLIPIGSEAIMQAITLNGVAVDLNQLAFARGRQWLHEPAKIEADLKPKVEKHETLDDVIAHRVAHLKAYRSARYAKRYLKLVEKVRSVDAGEVLTQAVAHNLAKLMAYKDEYEVARLFTNGTFEKQINDQFEGDFELNFHLAPPLTSKIDPMTGRPRKKAYGPSMMRKFRLLASLKGLRGTPFDIFGYSAERKEERGLIKWYETLVARLISEYDQNTYDVAVAMARLPEMARGYGPVKAEGIAKMHAEEAVLRQQLKETQGQRADAA